MAKQSKGKAKVILFKSKTLKNGKHPIMLRITHKSKRKYYSTDYDATPDEWKAIMKSNPEKKFEDTNLELVGIETKARITIRNIEEKYGYFSHELFVEKFFKSSQTTKVYDYFQKRIDEINSEQRIKTARSYNDVLQALKRFHPKETLTFHDVTPSFLRKFENHLRKKCSQTSIGIYLRTFKALYNHAVKHGYASQENNPFLGYKIKKGESMPRALTKAQVQSIFSLEFEPYTPIWYAKTYFIFCYLANGMNFTDLALLKWKNILDGRLYYIRAKTKNSSKEPDIFSIKIDDKLNDILSYFRNSHTDEDDFIFPILKPGLSPDRRIDVIEQARKIYNKYLKKIGDMLEIEGNMTSYVTRHSFATVLKKNGVPIEIISEKLGHENISTTKAYLKKFDDEEMDKVNESLL